MLHLDPWIKREEVLCASVVCSVAIIGWDLCSLKFPFSANPHVYLYFVPSYVTLPIVNCDKEVQV